MFRFTTAGESHGRALVLIVEGMPSDVPVDVEFINHQLARRQKGYGRGGRMKIERDTAQILSGVRHGVTLGSPVAMTIENKDWQNWTDVMSVEAVEIAPEKSRVLTRPRPGHADLAGGQKFNQTDLRNVLERASARETAARVACGAMARLLLKQFDVEIASHVVQLGGVPDVPLNLSWDDITNINDDEPLRCGDANAQTQMIALIDRAKKDGDTLGGVFEVVVKNLVAGLGAHTSWDAKLDGQFAGAIVSIPAVKACAIGDGFEIAGEAGSKVHDEITFNTKDATYARRTNRAGGLEGGITNGEELRVRGYLKPIATLRTRLASVDIVTKQDSPAGFERSDTTAVPAAGVIGEAMVALVLARAMREKFGGDSLGEMKRNFDGYKRQLSEY